MAKQMSFPYATLCVQGIKDGTSRSSIEAQFEDFGKIRDVTITPNKHMRGVPDSKLALVEFERKADARKAMQALNGRFVQGKCVMIRFARSAPGIRPPAPLPRHGAPELIPQTAGRAAMLSMKFQPADQPREAEQARTEGKRSRSRRKSRGASKERKKSGSKSRRQKSRSRSRKRRSCSKAKSKHDGKSAASPERRKRASKSRSRKDRGRRGDTKRGESLRSRSAGRRGGSNRSRPREKGASAAATAARAQRSPSRWRPSSPG